MGQHVDNLWITIGTTLACPELARVLLVCNIRARSRVGMGFAWGATFVPTRGAPKVGTGFAWGATSVPTLEVARVLHGVQHLCQCACWHGVCMG